MKARKSKMGKGAIGAAVLGVGIAAAVVGGFVCS